jgi:hypothetical protein
MHLRAERWNMTDQLTGPGPAEKLPMMHKCVPKYLTPDGASVRLMIYPSRAIDCPANMNGERTLSLSERCANTNVVTPHQDLSFPSSDNELGVPLTAERIGGNGQ